MSRRGRRRAPGTFLHVSKEKRAGDPPAVYQVGLSLSSKTVTAVVEAIRACRKRVRSRWRKKTDYQAALIVLGHLRHDQRLADLAGGNQISASTVRRWTLQVVRHLAARAARLQRALKTARTRSEHVLLDGTLIRSTRRHGRTGKRTYNGKHHTHGLHFSILTDPIGNLIWISKARPGRTHDATAARADHLVQRLQQADLGAVADLLYTALDPDRANPTVLTGRRNTNARKLTAAETQTNLILSAERAANEHPLAYLKNWRILTKLRSSHRNATALLRALTVLTQIENPRSLRSDRKS